MNREQLKSQVMTNEAWLARHRDHGDLTIESFPHRFGQGSTLICECGSRHVTCAATAPPLAAAEDPRLERMRETCDL